MERQVPREAFPLLVGNGRLARHLRHYLGHLDLPYESWWRGQEENDLLSSLAQSDLVLLSISDDAISPFLERYQNTLAGKEIVHFSGSLYLPQAVGMHPLFTFGHTLYPPEVYPRIPFVVDGKEPAYFQAWPNPRYAVAGKDKGLYHALCVLGGNFTSILWQKVFDAFIHRLHLPREAALPYLEQVTANLIANPEGALTGPLARGDQGTIDRNLKALENDPFAKVYEAFVEAYSAQLQENMP